jgi:hypothetical protein
MTRHPAARMPRSAHPCLGPTRRARAALAAASVIALALTGCATADATATEPSASPEPTPLAVTVPMPDLGPVPEPDPPLGEAESEAKRIEAADQRWMWVVASHPEAVRPADPFEAYVTDDQRVEVMTACLEAAGVPIERGYGSPDLTGPVLSVTPMPENESQAVAGYVCDVAHPVKVVAGFANDAELGWIYDYLTRFTVPCYEANGIENPPAPSRDQWVANWPDQGWFPTTGDVPLEAEFEAALAEACPHADETIQRLRSEQG